MEIHILTLFPGMFKGPFSESIIKIARKKKLARIKVHNLRKWTLDRHKTADDKPYGGGSGMVMKVEPVYRALAAITRPARLNGSKTGAGRSGGDGSKIILMTPQGKKLDQSDVKKIAKLKKIILICGHYEGVDERIRSLADNEVSIGDYILSSGEIPAMALTDAVVRLLPGVLGNPESVSVESFEKNLLEYPQYTRPQVFEGMGVPDILLSGDHKRIAAWRAREAEKRTVKKRPDLLMKIKKEKK